MVSGRLRTLLAFERFRDDGASPLRSATQQAVPVAIAEAAAAAAEGLARAIVDFVVKAAMIGAIRTAAEGIGSAVVAEPPRQQLRVLPIHLHDRCMRRQGNRHGRGADRSRKATQQGKYKSFHDMVSDEIAIDGASTGAFGSLCADGLCIVDDGRASGKRMTKREPSPSRLLTSMLPLCRSTAFLTR